MKLKQNERILNKLKKYKAKLSDELEILKIDEYIQEVTRVFNEEFENEDLIQKADKTVNLLTTDVTLAPLLNAYSIVAQKVEEKLTPAQHDLSMSLIHSMSDDYKKQNLNASLQLLLHPHDQNDIEAHNPSDLLDFTDPLKGKSYNKANISNRESNVPDSSLAHLELDHTKKFIHLEEPAKEILADAYENLVNSTHAEIKTKDWAKSNPHLLDLSKIAEQNSSFSLQNDKFIEDLVKYIDSPVVLENHNLDGMIAKTYENAEVMKDHAIEICEEIDDMLKDKSLSKETQTVLVELAHQITENSRIAGAAVELVVDIAKKHPEYIYEKDKKHTVFKAEEKGREAIDAAHSLRDQLEETIINHISDWDTQDETMTDLDDNIQTAQQQIDLLQKESAAATASERKHHFNEYIGKYSAQELVDAIKPQFEIDQINKSKIKNEPINKEDVKNFLTQYQNKNLL